MTPIRLIGANGEQVGIVPTREALDRARDLGLDLVEVAPTSRPPVCRIMDFGKYKYELSKKEKIAKKKQHTFQLKEMRYRPKIDDHDFDFKTKHVREFLESGSKVKVFVQFRGREMAHQEFGHTIIQQIIKELEDVAQLDVPPKMEGNMLSMVMSPRPEVIRKMQAQRTPQPKDKGDKKPDKPAQTEDEGESDQASQS
ncbi:MAG: translation initiation factor IF-3 [candidate division Zixibacteria bacterium]|nr:translation initiation factor IF-3 [candidate division Zixibacteria bacterium]